MVVYDYKAVWYDGVDAGTVRFFSFESDCKKALKNYSTKYSDLEFLKIELYDSITLDKMVHAIMAYNMDEQRDDNYYPSQVKVIKAMEDFIANP